MVLDGDQVVGHFDDLFDVGLQDTEFYPGSKERRSQQRQPAPEPSPFDGVTPKVYTVNGTEIEFFTIGQLAAALDRKPNTLRKWENTGVIPKATFQAPNPRGLDTARRRLYTRAQAEGVVRIFHEEMDNGLPKLLSSTRFTERVFALFKELREAK